MRLLYVIRVIHKFSTSMAITIDCSVPDSFQMFVGYSLLVDEDYDFQFSYTVETNSCIYSNCVFYRLWQRELRFFRGYAILQLKKLEDLSDAATRCTHVVFPCWSCLERDHPWVEESDDCSSKEKQKVVEERSSLGNMLPNLAFAKHVSGRCWICKSHCCSTVLHARTALFRVRGVTARHHSCHSLAGALESWRDFGDGDLHELTIWTEIGHVQRFTWCVSGTSDMVFVLNLIVARVSYARVRIWDVWY